MKLPHSLFSVASSRTNGVAPRLNRSTHSILGLNPLELPPAWTKVQAGSMLVSGNANSSCCEPLLRPIRQEHEG